MPLSPRLIVHKKITLARLAYLCFFWMSVVLFTLYSSDRTIYVSLNLHSGKVPLETSNYAVTCCETNYTCPRLRSLIISSKKKNCMWLIQRDVSELNCFFVVIYFQQIRETRRWYTWLIKLREVLFTQLYWGSYKGDLWHGSRTEKNRGSRITYIKISFSRNTKISK